MSLPRAQMLRKRVIHGRDARATSEISRRSFLISSAACVAFPFAGTGQELIERGIFSDRDVPEMRENLLDQLNSERARAGLNQLKLDELACKVASEHALD